MLTFPDWGKFTILLEFPLYRLKDLPRYFNMVINDESWWSDLCICLPRDLWTNMLKLFHDNKRSLICLFEVHFETRSFLLLHVDHLWIICRRWNMHLLDSCHEKLSQKFSLSLILIWSLGWSREFYLDWLLYILQGKGEKKVTLDIVIWIAKEF